MTEEERKEWIWYAYRDAMELSKEGMDIEELEQVLTLYEEEELYLHCAGIKEAIDDLKEAAKEEYELAKLIESAELIKQQEDENGRD